jgi:hypothetical protein
MFTFKNNTSLFSILGKNSKKCSSVENSYARSIQSFFEAPWSKSNVEK